MLWLLMFKITMSFDNAAITPSCIAQPPGGASALIVAVMEPLHSIDPVVPAPNEFLLPLGTGPFANSWCIRCGPEAVRARITLTLHHRVNLTLHHRVTLTLHHTRRNLRPPLCFACCCHTGSCGLQLLRAAGSRAWWVAGGQERAG